VEAWLVFFFFSGFFFPFFSFPNDCAYGATVQLDPEADTDDEVRRTRPTYQNEEDKGRRAADKRSRNKIRDTVKDLQVRCRMRRWIDVRCIERDLVGVRNSKGICRYGEPALLCRYLLY
jgi:hypothetical protein